MFQAARLTLRQPLRRQWTVKSTLLSRVTPVTPKPLTVLRPYSAAAPASSRNDNEEPTDLVRSAIQRMLSENESDAVKTAKFAQKDLQESLQQVEHQLEEARLCIQDCRTAETGTLEYATEVAEASQALHKAVSAFADWLDDLRQLEHENGDKNITALFQRVRESKVMQIRRLRQQLEDLEKSQQHANE